MKVKDVMTKGVEGVAGSDTILLAATRMKELDVGALAVFDSEKNIKGMITDRDITLRVVGASLNPAQVSIEEVMSKEPVTCSEDDDLSEAAHTMENYRVRRLLVKDDQGKISGILTIDDIARRGEQELVTEVINQVREHAGPKR